jgi:hypothetical protein
MKQVNDTLKFSLFIIFLSLLVYASIYAQNFVKIEDFSSIDGIIKTVI